METNFDKISDLIIENNNQFIVCNKPAGLPSVPDKSNDTNIQNLLESYCKQSLHALSRIDRPVSGIMLFSKNNNATTTLTEQLKNRSVQKVYYGFVEGHLDTDQGEMVDYLIKKGNKAQVVPEGSKDSKIAKLSYKVVDQLERYTLLELELITGRFHQIRAQLAHIGHPLKGDVKYGARRKNRDRSIHLHAYKLKFNHPVTNEEVEYHADFPNTDSLWDIAKSKV